VTAQGAIRGRGIGFVSTKKRLEPRSHEDHETALGSLVLFVLFVLFVAWW
jgi:hypothetical protein